MKAVEYPRVFNLEDHHWWYLGMEGLTRALLNRYLPASKRRQILDAGCGTGGAMVNYLGDFGNVTGFDTSPLALRFCQERGLRGLVRASVADVPFSSGTFDVITCFDVLYLVQRAQGAVEEFARVLRPGGHVLLRVAAYDWLRGTHDETVRTVHRYTLDEVVNLLESSGLQVVHASYANTILFPLMAAKRFLERVWPPERDASDLTATPRGVSMVLRLVLAAEAFLAARVRLPFGLSICALAQVPAEGQETEVTQPPVTVT